MAGKIIADTLEHSTAGSIATNYVVDGVVKMHHDFNGSGTVTTNESLNVSSLTDEGTGDYTTTFSSNFSNQYHANNHTNNYYGYGEIQNKTSSTSRNRCRGNGSYTTLVDTSVMCVISNGDLA